MSTIFGERNKTGGIAVVASAGATVALVDVKLKDSRAVKVALHTSAFGNGVWVLQEGSTFAATQFELTPTATREVVELVGNAFQVSWRAMVPTQTTVAAYLGALAGE